MQDLNLLMGVGCCSKCMLRVLLLNVYILSVVQEAAGLAEGASVPALGLSNKAVFANSAQPGPAERPASSDQYAESYFTPQALTGLMCGACMSYCPSLLTVHFTSFL